MIYLWYKTRSKEITIVDSAREFMLGCGSRSRGNWPNIYHRKNDNV